MGVLGHLVSPLPRRLRLSWSPTGEGWARLCPPLFGLFGERSALCGFLPQCLTQLAWNPQTRMESQQMKFKTALKGLCGGGIWLHLSVVARENGFLSVLPVLSPSWALGALCPSAFAHQSPPISLSKAHQISGSPFLTPGPRGTQCFALSSSAHGSWQPCGAVPASGSPPCPRLDSNASTCSALLPSPHRAPSTLHSVAKVGVTCRVSLASSS